MIDGGTNSSREPIAPEIPECWALEPPVMGKATDERGGWESHWEGLEGTPQFFREQAKEYVRSLELALPLYTNARVLDFGCGFGFVAKILAPKVGQVFLWDASANMRRRARLNVATHENVRFLDFSNSESVHSDLCFDLILVNSVVQYMPIHEFSAWLIRWRAMLSPGGRIIVSDLIPPDHNSILDIIDLLKFSVRHGVLGNAILRSFLKLGRYWRVRRTWPLARIGLEQLSQKARAASLAVNCLPRNLTQFSTRFTAILTEADSY